MCSSAYGLHQPCVWGYISCFIKCCQHKHQCIENMLITRPTDTRWNSITQSQKYLLQVIIKEQQLVIDCVVRRDAEIWMKLLKEKKK